jgi:DNA-directed RNA polymerase sigma subunit (sigma70/sigma32)
MSQNTSTALVANNLPIPSALGSLDAYIGAVHQIPVLSVDDEQDLARRFRDGNDLDAAASWCIRTCASWCTWPAATTATALPWAT